MTSERSADKHVEIDMHTYVNMNVKVVSVKGKIEKEQDNHLMMGTREKDEGEPELRKQSA